MIIHHNLTFVAFDISLRALGKRTITPDRNPRTEPSQSVSAIVVHAL